MASGRILHSGNLVRGFHVGDRKLFMIQRSIWTEAVPKPIAEEGEFLDKIPRG